QAIGLDPSFVGTEYNLGSALDQQGNIKAAAEIYGRLIERDPEDQWLRLRMAALCPPVAENAAAIDHYRDQLYMLLDDLRYRRMALDPEWLHLRGVPPPFGLTYQGRDDRELKALWASLFQELPPTGKQRPGKDKPHLGFIVTRGHEGTFLRSMGGLLNRLQAA